MSAISNTTLGLPNTIESYIGTPGLTILGSALVIFVIYKCCTNNNIKSEEVFKTCNLGDKEIKLIKDKADLKWIVKNKTGEVSTSAAMDDLNFFRTYIKDLGEGQSKLFIKQGEFAKACYEKGDKETGLRWLKGIPIDRRISFFKDILITGMRWNTVTKIMEMDLKYPQFSSRYDKSVKLTRDDWAVTVLCRTDKRDTDCVFGHAVIAYEGVIEGTPFIRYAHISLKKKNGVGIAKPKILKKVNEQNDRIYSQTWSRESYWVSFMIKKIEKDIENYNNDKYIYFDTLNITAINVIKRPFTGHVIRHNCMSWVVRTVWEANIDMATILPNIPTLQVPVAKQSTCTIL